MTPTLLEKGYVAGYNTPYTQEIYDKLGYDPVSNYHFIKLMEHMQPSQEESFFTTIIQG